MIVSVESKLRYYPKAASAVESIELDKRPVIWRIAASKAARAPWTGNGYGRDIIEHEMLHAVGMRERVKKRDPRAERIADDDVAAHVFVIEDLRDAVEFGVEFTLDIGIFIQQVPDPCHDAGGGFVSGKEDGKDFVAHLTVGHAFAGFLVADVEAHAE